MATNLNDENQERLPGLDGGIQLNMDIERHPINLRQMRVDILLLVKWSVVYSWSHALIDFGERLQNFMNMKNVQKLI